MSKEPETCHPPFYLTVLLSVRPGRAFTNADPVTQTRERKREREREREKGGGISDGRKRKLKVDCQTVSLES